MLAPESCEDGMKATHARGEGELMLARERALSGKLIRLRTDFNSEPIRSADRH
jgi:hypothetical protein